MPRQKKPINELALGRLMRAAKDFCEADRNLQLSRRQWADIQSVHDQSDGGICFLPWTSPYAEEGDPGRDPLPKQKWCEHCLKYNREKVDYYDALWGRRAAKRRMTRAYKDLQSSQ